MNVSISRQSVVKAKHWGVMHFKKNYSEALFERMFGIAGIVIPNNETLDQSEVHVSLDMTNQQVRM